MKRIVCLDFDGVIHSYTSGWQGETVIPDPPVDGAFEAIREYLTLFNVVIYSSRSQKPGGIDAMKAWFLLHGWKADDHGEPEYIEFATEKPPASVTIDDRAITFNGTFPSTGDLYAFKPWNKQ